MKSFFGKNIRALRKSLNLSVKRFSELTGVSASTIVNIEQGHTGLKVETIGKIIEFTWFSIEEMNSENFKVPSNIREKLFSYHRDNTLNREFFMNRPKILDAVDERLINSEFFKSFREIREIVQYFDEIGWEILGPSLHNELKKHKNVEIKRHPIKKNTNLYRRKLQ